jgi:hypothetical protein
MFKIWFRADKKIIRYDTKDSDENDSDPYMIILDFNTGTCMLLYCLATYKDGNYSYYKVKRM